MLSVVTWLLVVTQSCIKQIENAEDVIKQMHATYEGKWYKNMTFRQETSFYAGDSLQRQQTWYEAAKIGEGLVIKFDSINSGNGYIFKKDSMYIYNNDKLVNSAPRVHDILELGFNIYRQEPSTTIEKLKKAGLDFTFFGESDTHYLIGDAKNKQAFIEKERLLFSKIISIQGVNTSRIEFNKYEPLGDAWISPEVLFFANDKMTMKEVYFDIEAPETLPEHTYAGGPFSAVVW